MLLLKTHKEHFAAVRKNALHATDAKPREVKLGDWLLVQVTSGKPGSEIHRVRYAMRFKACKLDTAGTSKLLWNHQWKYLIWGTDGRQLLTPFDIESIQVSGTNYGQGVIRFAYVHPRDEAEIIRKNMLAGA